MILPFDHRLDRPIVDADLPSGISAEQLSAWLTWADYAFHSLDTVEEGALENRWVRDPAQFSARHRFLHPLLGRTFSATFADVSDWLLKREAIEAREAILKSATLKLRRAGEELTHQAILTSAEAGAILQALHKS
jgi:hypothetical protein